MGTKQIKKRFKLDRTKLAQAMIRSRTGDKLEEIKQYYEELERKFQADKKQLSKRYKEKVADDNLHPDIKREVDEYFAEEHYIIENIFLKSFRYSMVVTSYSLLEIAMNDLCHYLRHSKKLSLNLDEIKGEGIERAKLYLSKVCSIDFPERSAEWNDIQKVNRIRNCIVHAEGDIEYAKSPQKLKNIVMNTSGLSLYRDRYIRIDSVYIFSAISNTHKLLEMIYEKAFKTV